MINLLSRKFSITPLMQRHIAQFKTNRRGVWSLRIFIVLFTVTLFAEIVANDRPIVVIFDGGVYSPIFKTYAETEFGGEFPTEADYRDPYVATLINNNGWMMWPPIPFNHQTVAWDLPVPAPLPPDGNHLLGTDDQARDVLAQDLLVHKSGILCASTVHPCKRTPPRCTLTVEVQKSLHCGHTDNDNIIRESNHGNKK